MGKREHDLVWSDEVATALARIDCTQCDNPAAWPAEVREKYQNRRPCRTGESEIENIRDLRSDLLRVAMDKRGEPEWFLAGEILSAAMDQADGLVLDLLHALDGAMSGAYYSAEREHLAMVPQLDMLIPAIEFEQIIERVSQAV